MKLKSPQQAIQPISKHHESESLREPPSLRFPAWSMPTNSLVGIEGYEKVKTGCWEYRPKIVSSLEAYDLIAERLKEKSISGINPTPGVSVFWKEMRNARRHIYLFDNHIGPNEFCRILQVLLQRESIMDVPIIQLLLLTSLSKNADQKAIQSMLTEVKSNMAKTRISIIATKGDGVIHDRFALIDNYIWHFGSTIGAMHRSFNAFSGPWEDKGKTMHKFFHYLVKHYKGYKFFGSPFYSEVDDG